MVEKSDIVMLGINAGVVGSLLGGMLLGLGLALVGAGANIGWLLILPAAPAAGMVGWLLGRQLARKLG